MVTLHCNENPIYVFIFWELHGFSFYFHIHVSVSDLYIPRIGPHTWLQQNRQTRVSFETCFDSKQRKLEPKLVLALSETKSLFRLFRFYTETESFDVLIEPKQTEIFCFWFLKQIETNAKQILF